MASTRILPARALLLLVAALAVLAGCVDQPGAVVCATGIVCPEGTTCAAAQPVCIANTCGNGRVDTGETCDDGNILSGDGCSPACANETCGNGIVEPGERCDDNNTNNGDGCSGDCQSLEECGNGIVDLGKNEGCDDGNTIAGDGCRGDCKAIEFCGNGLVDVGEVCDDGEPVGGPCSPDCLSGLGCGNGFLDPGEECDDGNTDDNDDCRFPSCKHAVCGDGVENTAGIRLEECDGGTTGTPVETAICNIDCTDRACGDGKVNQTANEECDNGTLVDSADCDNDCTTPICGDNHFNTLAGEVCDPGAIGADIATCDSDCTAPSCNDNHVNHAFIPPGGTVAEGCDDGGTTSGDGCSAVCQIETCGNGVIEAINGEQCDDGNLTDTDACRNNCQLPRCGDGIDSASEVCDTGGNSATCNFNCTAPACNDSITNQFFTPAGAPGPETCDDGNLTAGDGCSALCQIETCGNTIVEAINGEQCDDGNLVDTDGCRNNCQLPRCGDGIASASETCDTSGNTLMCDFDCTAPICNDGIQNTAAGEQCEDGNLTNGDGCSSMCKLEPFSLAVVLSGNGTGTVTGTGINCGSDCAEVYAPGTAVALTATPAVGSTFVGWSGGGCTTGTCNVTMSVARTVTATFAINRLSVTKTGTGSGTVSGGGINCGATCTADLAVGTMVTLTATPTDTNSVFDGFTGGGCTTSPCSLTVNQATAVSASFIPATFNVNVSKVGTGTVTSGPTGIDCGATCAAGFSAGTVVTLFATAGANFTFTGWSGDCTGTAPCIVTMTAAKAVTATFAQNTAQLTVSVSGTGGVTGTGIACGTAGADCTETYDAGTAVALTATPSLGNVFVGWSGGGCSGTGACNLTMDVAKAVTATFAPNRLTVVRVGDGTGNVTSVPAGITCGADCTEDYNAGQGVTLTATATGSSVFTGWVGGGCSGTGTCAVTMNGAVIVFATFEPPQPLTVNVVGTGTVTADAGAIACPGTCTDNYPFGSTVTLTAATAGTFVGWTNAPGCAAAVTCPVTTDQARTVTATFNP